MMIYQPYLGPDLLDKFLECLLGNILRTGGLEFHPSTGGLGHGHIGARAAVDILDDVRDGPPELVARQDVLGVQQDALHVPAGDGYGRGAASRSGSSGARGSSPRVPVGGIGGRPVRLAIGGLGTPDGGAGPSS